jgi:putative endonuclease
LDIVAREGRTVVFVEVKARESRDFGEPAEAVTALKRRKMTQLALDYLVRHRLRDCPCRFDVVSIYFGASEPSIEVYRNAFGPSF